MLSDECTLIDFFLEMKLALVCSLLCVAMVMQATEGAPQYYVNKYVYPNRPVINWVGNKHHDGVNECKWQHERCDHESECCSEDCQNHYCAEGEDPEEA